MILQFMDRDPRAGAFRVYVGPISPVLTSGIHKRNWINNDKQALFMDR